MRLIFLLLMQASSCLAQQAGLCHNKDVDFGPQYHVLFKDVSLRPQQVPPARALNSFMAEARCFNKTGKARAVENHAQGIQIQLVLKTFSKNVNKVPDHKPNQFDLNYSVYRIWADDTLHLLDINEKTSFGRTPPQSSNLNNERSSALLENSLRALKVWLDREAPTNPLLVKKIQVYVSEYSPAGEVEDTLFYALHPHLAWKDFTGEVPRSRFEAEVFPVLSYLVKPAMKDQILYLNIQVRASLPKSSMWAKPGGRDAEALMHEQKHFDLLEISARDFMIDLRKYSFSPQNYEGELSYLYLDAWRHMSALEEKYDAETMHGLKLDEQHRWNDQIESLLDETGSTNREKERTKRTRVTK